MAEINDLQNLVNEEDETTSPSVVAPVVGEKSTMSNIC
jgi:hypothetical protein